MSDSQAQKIQQMFDDEDFKMLITNIKHSFFEEWARERKLDKREKIHAKLEAMEDLLTAMQAAADSIAIQKLRG
tara:strand:- start:269 stop:490 length:222 start_codon:yes stop_codon:yes gene_type:complete